MYFRAIVRPARQPRLATAEDLSGQLTSRRTK
jgi:hypothetical protein